MALQRIYGQIIYWDSSIGDVLPNINIAIGTKAVDVGDTLAKSEWDGSTWRDGWHYYVDEFTYESGGGADQYRPVLLNAMGQIDPSMLDTSSFYPVGTHDPSAGVEYPDETGQTHGAFWMVEELTAPTDTDPEPHYIFTAGDLTGKAIRIGDFMVWGAAGWSIMAGEMNPTLYYKLDGSNPLTGDMQADNHKITMIADGTADQDAVNFGQLGLKADITYVNSENAAQDAIIAGKADITYVDSENTAQDTLISGLRTDLDAHEADVANPHDTSWGNLLGKPTEFPPAPHDHDADYVELAGDIMSGNLIVGNTETYGSVGVSNNGDEATGKSSFILRDQNDNPRGTFYSTNAGYVGFQKQADDQSVDAEFGLMVDGNIRSQISITPSNEMDLTPKKYVDDKETGYDLKYLRKDQDDVTPFSITGENFIIQGSSPSHHMPTTGSVLTLVFDSATGLLTLTQTDGTDVVSNPFDGRYELGLGLPASNGMLLSSDTSGSRTWINPPTTLPSGGLTWDLLRKATDTSGDAEWAESRGTFVIDIDWAGLVAACAAGTVKKWDKFNITDIPGKEIDIKLIGVDGANVSYWYEEANYEGMVSLLKVE